MSDDDVTLRPPAEYVDPYREMQRAIRRAHLEMLDEADVLLDALKTVADTTFNSLELQQLLSLDRRQIRERVRVCVAEAEASLQRLVAALDQAEHEDADEGEDEDPGPGAA